MRIKATKWQGGLINYAMDIKKKGGISCPPFQ